MCSVLSLIISYPLCRTQEYIPQHRNTSPQYRACDRVKRLYKGRFTGLYKGSLTSTRFKNNSRFKTRTLKNHGYAELKLHYLNLDKPESKKITLWPMRIISPHSRPFRLLPLRLATIRRRLASLAIVLTITCECYFRGKAIALLLLSFFSLKCCMHIIYADARKVNVRPIHEQV